MPPFPPCIDTLNNFLIMTLNTHAPINTKYLSVHPNTPWYNSALSSQKRTLRNKERIYVKYPTSLNHDTFKIYRSIYKSAMNKAKSIFYQNKINEFSRSPRHLFKLTSSLMGTSKKSQYPNIPAHILCTQFSNQLNDKTLNTLRSIAFNIATVSPLFSNYDINVFSLPLSCSFTSFFSISLTEILSLLNSVKSTSSVDPIPLSVFKKSSHFISNQLLSIYSHSLIYGIFPTSFKRSHIKLILKKNNLDTSVLTNFRPISQLSIMSKILERIVSKQIFNYLSVNNILDPHQSAFKKHHSTETALTSVLNDLLTTLDDNQCIQMVLLDLSSAFDTINHDILINRLYYLGISDAPLLWFKSYLSNRSSSVQIGESLSSPIPVTCGVPQGSVLGPLLFTLYILPLSKLIQSFPDISYHIYADDIQLYIKLPINSSPDSNLSLSNCIRHINFWLLSNFLLLNETKTELINISHSQSTFPPLSVNNSLIHPKPFIKNLGFIFDTNLNYDRHISNICKISNLHIYKIRSIRKFITKKSCSILINSLIFSRLDYCNSLLCSLPSISISKIDRIIRASTRLTFNLSYSDYTTSVSSLMSSLKWLTFKNRCLFKLLCLTHKLLLTHQPIYLYNLLDPINPLNSLRSTRTIQLKTHPYKKKIFGGRSFKCMSPINWNSIPINIRNINNHATFKTRLKLLLLRRQH